MSRRESDLSAPNAHCQIGGHMEIKSLWSTEMKGTLGNCG